MRLDKFRLDKIVGHICRLDHLCRLGHLIGIGVVRNNRVVVNSDVIRKDADFITRHVRINTKPFIIGDCVGRILHGVLKHQIVDVDYLTGNGFRSNYYYPIEITTLQIEELQVLAWRTSGEELDKTAVLEDKVLVNINDYGYWQWSGTFSSIGLEGTERWESDGEWAF